MKRARLFGAVAIAVVLAATGCSGGDDTTDAAAETVTGTADGPAGSASDTQDGPVGRWSGSWQSVGERAPASLNIVTAQPLLATIDIPGRCGATWKEAQRQGNRVIVDATVTYGQCSDNQWSVEITDDSIVATDTADGGTRVSFTKD